MSRTVSVPHNAVAVAYNELDIEYNDPWSFEDYVEWFREGCFDLWPSLLPASYWIGRELKVLAVNAHAQIGLSEYCGLVALWVVPQDDDQWYGLDRNGLHQHWCQQIAPKFVKTFSTLVHIATFSNGEAVYRRLEV